MADARNEPRDADAHPDDSGTDAESKVPDQHIYEVLGIELRFAPEHLAPPVDEQRLKAFIDDELSPDDRNETIDLIASFQSWYKAFGDALRQNPGRPHSELP